MNANDWQDLLLSDNTAIDQILRDVHTIAVIGIKAPGGGPAHYVPAYLIDQGYEIIPINPGLTEVFGRKPLKNITEIQENVDLVNIFRRSEFIPDHVDEILSMPTLPKVVWLQLGIRNDDAARRLAQAGIQVVQDRCILVDHRRIMLQP